MAGTAVAAAFVGPDAPDMAALRRCVHCGICLPACPTYRVLGEEMDSPRGRIYLLRAAAEGRLGLTPTLTRHLDLCLGCRACETACPSGVPFGALLVSARSQLARTGEGVASGPLGRLIFGLFPAPARLGVALRALRLYQRSGLQRLLRASGVLQRRPRLAAMDALLPTVPRGERLPMLTPARGARHGRVGLLIGCVQRHLYPDVNRDTARLLSLAGWEVVVPASQGCCGALDLHAGRLDVLRARARALAAVFPEDVDWVVTNAAGCGSAMREYAHWLPGEPVVERLASRVRDVSQLLAEAALPFGPLEVTATYHDACHLAHGQGVRREPRALLARIPGLRLIELPDSDLCCGSAGVFNLLQPEMADRLLRMKVARIATTRASIVVAGNPGCLLQIAKGCQAQGLDVEVLHPVQLLARALDQGEAPR